MYLPQDRYVAALERQLKRITDGLELKYFDDTTPGQKATACTWGLCSDEKEAWPDAKDHLWPHEFLNRGRVAPKYLKSGQKCPLDTRELGDPNPNGCFYTCHIFQAKMLGGRPTREQTITLYTSRLKELKTWP